MKDQKKAIQLILFGLPCDNLLYSSLRIVVVRWHSVSNSKVKIVVYSNSNSNSNININNNNNNNNN